MGDRLLPDVYEEQYARTWPVTFFGYTMSHRSILCWRWFSPVPLKIAFKMMAVPQPACPNDPQQPSTAAAPYSPLRSHSVLHGLLLSRAPVPTSAWLTPPVVIHLGWRPEKLRSPIWTLSCLQTREQTPTHQVLRNQMLWHVSNSYLNDHQC